MKKTTMSAIVNTTIMATGIAITVLSNSKNFHRRISAMNKASAEISRQLANEKLIREEENKLLRYYEKKFLTGQYYAGKEFDFTYGEFFLLHQAAFQVYRCEQQINVGKYFTDDLKHFRAHERFIADGKLFIFISNKEDEMFYDDGSDRFMSYTRICQSNKNLDGKMYVFDVEEVKKENSEIWNYGEYLVLSWKSEKDNKQCRTV